MAPASAQPSQQPSTPEPRHPNPEDAARALSGQRAALTSHAEILQFPIGVYDPQSADLQWRSLSLDSDTLSRISPTKLADLMVDVSPDVSRALWDFLRMCNPGYEATAMLPNSDTPAAEPTQQVLNSIIGAIAEHYGTFDIVINSLFIAGFMRGSFMAEGVIGSNGRDLIDIATPDPAIAKFKRVNDPERGPVWKLGQWEGAKFTFLDSPLIRFVPIDPLPGQPFGRSLASPALFTALFMINIMHDLRRVIAQQGYPRLDLVVDLDELLKIMPPDLQSDPDAFAEWAGKAIDQIQSVYRGLKPEDAYVHTSVVKVNRPVGTVDSSSLGAIDGIIRALERQSVRALKTMPIMMGLNEGASETHANRQWEIYVAGIKALQHIVESVLSHILGLGLRGIGIAATVKLRFSELRAAEEMRDQQTLALKIQNNKAMYDNGWIDQDEAAENVVGHAPAVDTPRTAVPGTGQTTSELLNINPDTGSQRGVVTNGRRAVVAVTQ